MSLFASPEMGVGKGPPSRLLPSLQREPVGWGRPASARRQGVKLPPSASQRGAEEGELGERRWIRSRRHVRRQRGRHAFSDLAVSPAFRGAARAGEKRSCARRADPPANSAPTRGRRRANHRPRTELSPDDLRRQKRKTEERQGEGDRRPRVEPLRHRLAGHHRQQRATMRASKSTGTKLSRFWLLAWTGWPSKLPRPTTMTVQRQLPAGRPTGNTAVRAPSRPHLAGRRVTLHPPLDVHFTSYDSSSASYSISQWPKCGARLEACLRTPRVTSSRLIAIVSAGRQRAVSPPSYIKKAVTPKPALMMASRSPATNLPGK